MISEDTQDDSALHVCLLGPTLPASLCALGTRDSPLLTICLQEQQMLGAQWALRVEWLNAIPSTFHSTVGPWLKCWGKTASSCLWQILRSTLQSPGKDSIPSPLGAFRFQPGFTVPFSSCGFYQFHLLVLPRLYWPLLSSHLFSLCLLSNYYAYFLNFYL